MGMGTGTDVRGAGRSRGPAGADDPVLMSKITAPGLPVWAVARPRIERLIAEGARGPLTTVTGPPGAGKTMAIALWAAAGTYPGPLAWISLDGYDNRPKVFWSYVAAALRRAGITVPRVSPAPARGNAVDHVFLLRLASVLAAQDPPVAMVLDDLHLLTEPAALDGLAYLLRNARPGLHLVVSSRIDPNLRLHRYRLAGELTEIRADDLAFNVAESSLLLAHHGIKLSEATLKCLTGRTEGWAAGVRLAALSLDGHPDPEQFVKELDAEDSAITGYLVEEVLNAQPASVREVLLRTSVLDCVSTDLAGELVDDLPAASSLPVLARANAFVRPLGQGWYRYHSMFASVLRLKLRSESPDRLPELHRRAARWYQRNGWLAQAVRHAADSGDWQLAAGIVVDELAIGQLIESRGDEALAEALRRIPLDLTWTQPEPLLVIAAMELPDAASHHGASLAAAEGILESRPADDDIPARLAAALIRLAVSRRTGDLDAATAAVAAEALLEKLPESLLAQHPGTRAQVLSGRGAAELRAGRLDEAVATFRAGAAAASGPDTAYERADCLGYLALVEVLHGRLSRATELAGEAAEVTQSSSDGLAEQVSPAASVALAAVHLERGELRHAHGQLREADAALRISPDKLLNAVACLIAARCRLAEGRAAAASELICRARRDWSPPGWLDQRLTLLESRAYVAEGDTRAAIAAAVRAGPPSAHAVAVALAHAWLAAGDHQAARRALDTGAEGSSAAPEQARLEGWLVDARLSYGTGAAARGRRSLEHALRLGKREQLRLPFALEQAWIRHVLRRDPDLAYAYRQLLEPGPVRQRAAAAQTRQAVPGPGTPLIIERLSEREREVLRLLSGMLSTAEIAAEMYISVNTVKTHLRSIYRKLSAAHRSEAVRRARQLELI
jgi:LuxR family transcriptional regulator, maltose regulon positive regulatory protein